MHHQGSVLKNEIHKLLRDYEIQMDHLISTRRPDLVIIDKKRKKEKNNLPNFELCRPGRQLSKTERKRNER